MSVSSRTAERLIKLGLGSFVARAATTVYKLKGGATRKFSFDENGNWVDAQQDAVFVSPTLHTVPYADVRDTTLDIWAFDYMPKQGDVVVDIGAGIGTETVPFAKAVGPTGRVISVEAHPRTFDALKGTVTRSGLANVTVVHSAIADKEGELLISDNDFHIANSVVGVKDGFKVRAQTLDQLYVEQKIERIDYLKMNIEGAEALAIKGMTVILPAVTHAAIACHDFVADDGGAEDTRTLQIIRDFMKDNGFSTVERPDDPRPWVRDQVYGTRSAR